LKQGGRNRREEGGEKRRVAVLTWAAESSMLASEDQ